MLNAGSVSGNLPQEPGVQPSGSGFLANCYNPVNIQTHRLQCSDRSEYPEELSVDLSIENMRSLWSVGLQEEYDTSVCMLSARARGSLLTGCTCDSRDQLDLTTINQ